MKEYFRVAELFAGAGLMGGGFMLQDLKAYLPLNLMPEQWPLITIIYLRLRKYMMSPLSVKGWNMTYLSQAHPAKDSVL